MKERILALISYLGISNREFEIKCGMCNGYINSMRKGLGLPKIENVLKAYPNVNREWLVHGEGTMFRFDATSDSYEDAAKSLKEENEKLNEENEELRRRIERLEKMVDHLLEGGKMISKSCG